MFYPFDHSIFSFLPFLSLLTMGIVEGGGGSPDGGQPAGDPPPAAPAPEAPAAPVAETDPYKLLDALDGDVRTQQILERRRKWSPEDRAAADAMTNTIVQKRLAQYAKKFEGMKYGDKDVEARLAEAKAQWLKENGVQAGPDPDTQAMLDKFPAEQRTTVQAILDHQGKEAAKLRQELDGIRKPLQEREQAEQLQAFKLQLEQTAKEIIEKVPTADPYTIVDLLRANAQKPPEEQLTQEEIIATAQEIEDERFDTQLPARLTAKDEKTTNLLMTTLMDGAKKNEPWAAELMATMLSKYEEAKRGIPAGDRAAQQPKPGQPVKKWNADEARLGL